MEKLCGGIDVQDRGVWVGVPTALGQALFVYVIIRGRVETADNTLPR